MEKLLPDTEDWGLQDFSAEPTPPLAPQQPEPSPAAVPPVTAPEAAAPQQAETPTAQEEVPWYRRAIDYVNTLFEGEDVKPVATVNGTKEYAAALFQQGRFDFAVGEQALQRLNKAGAGLLSQEDREWYQDRVERTESNFQEVIKKLNHMARYEMDTRERQEFRTEMAEAASIIAGSLVQLAAANYGLKKGVDLSNVRFEKVDFSRTYERLNRRFDQSMQRLDAIYEMQFKKRERDLGAVEQEMQGEIDYQRASIIKREEAKAKATLSAERLAAEAEQLELKKKEVELKAAKQKAEVRKGLQSQAEADRKYALEVKKLALEEAKLQANMENGGQQQKLEQRQRELKAKAHEELAREILGDENIDADTMLSADDVANKLNGLSVASTGVSIDTSVYFNLAKETKTWKTGFWDAVRGKLGGQERMPARVWVEVIREVGSGKSPTKTTKESTSRQQQSDNDINLNMEYGGSGKDLPAP